MTQYAKADTERSSRGPYMGMAVFFLLLIVIGILFLVPKLRHRDDLEAEAKVAAGPPMVLATKLQQGDPSGHIELPATVQAFEQTPIYARTSGYVKARYVDIGDRVHRGQLLAEIEDPQTAQALMQAKATVLQQKAQLQQMEANASLSKVTNERWQGLVKQGVVSQQDADQRLAQAGADVANVAAAKANIAAGEANVRSLTDQASFSKVIAPFDGVILSRGIDRGSLISSGSQNSVTEMFTVGQADRVRVFTNVPQASASGLANGHVAKVTFRELPGKIYTGTIARTSQSIDPTTRTLLVEVDLKNDGRILPGMYATVGFDLPGNIASGLVLLPANGLVIRLAGPQAIVVDGDNIAHFRKIVLGRDLGTVTEVVSGLQAGDVVVLSPGDAVTDGTKVQPQLQK
jgi:RND family efflux transporter MFP subunit